MAGLGWRLRAVVLGLALGLAPAQAQRLPITTFTLEDGLPSAVIVDLAQDPSGRLWIAHQAGLSVYDGRTFRHHSEKTGLSPGEPGAVTVDSLGRVWTVTRWRGPGVGMWDGSEWHLLPEVDATLTAPGTLEYVSLAVVPGAGKDGGDLVAVASLGQGLFVWDGSAWTSFRRGSRPADLIRSLAAVGDRIAVGTGTGLCFLSKSGLDCSPNGRLTETIRGLSTVEVEGGGTRLWIYATGFLGYLDLAKTGNGVTSAPPPLVIVLDETALPEEEPRERGFLTPDAGGGLFFGSRWLYFLDAGRHGLRRLGMSDHLASDGVSALLTDREGNVWVGSPRGLSRIAPARFLSFDKDDGFLEEEVSAVFEQAPNQLILGHNKGLSFFDTREVTSTKLWHRPPESGPANVYRTMDFARDPHGTLWIAAYRLGVLSFSRETGLLTGESPYRVFLPGQAVLAVEIDSRGRLWAASFGKIYLYEDATFREIPLLQRKLLQTRWLIAGASGRLYAATREGLFWREDGWSEDRWQEAAGDVAEAANVFSVLEEPSSGRVLVGTLGGLRELRTEPSPRLTSVTEPGLAIDHPVYFILSGGDGVVWFGTDDGVRRWDGSSLRRLSVEHGLTGYETNRGAALYDQRGRFWVGTSRGLSVYQPEYDQPLPPPLSEIVSLEVNGEPLPLTEPIRLGYRQKNLTFRYTAVSLADAGDVLVRYRLAGFAEAEELVPASSSGIRYTNLSPGTYRFHLAAGREDGTWSDEVVSVPITISRPLWQMPWAWALTAFLVTGTVLGGFHLRTQALRARTAELEGYLRERDQALAERDQVIAELHEKNLELGRFTYTVSHDLKSPLVTIRGFLGFVKAAVQTGRTDRIRQDIERIEKASERMARLLDELLELSRLGRVTNPPEKVALPELAREAAELAAAAIAAAGAEVRIADDLGVVTGDRTRMREIFQNLLENAAKFMGQQPNPRIEVGRRPGTAGGGEDVVFVRDNGRGIDPRYQERIFGLFERLDHDSEGTGVGLALVQRIVELHGGRIWVESDGPGHGSTFCFTLAAPKTL